MNFNIIVQNKIAAPDETAPVIVCGNNGYVIDFIFDSEWDEYEIKNAVFNFKRNGRKKTIEVVFTGTQCNVPILSGIDEVEIGVYAGELQTTTPAKFACRKSALCDVSKVEDVPKDVYTQLLEILKNHYPIETAIEAKSAADYAYNQIEKANELIKQTFKDLYATLADKIDGEYVNDMLAGTVLWEKQDGLKFPAQTIELDLTEYERFSILFYSVSQGYFEFNFSNKDKQYVVHTPYKHTVNDIASRDVTITNTGVIFGNGNDGLTGDDGDYECMPMKIIGYRKFTREETPSIEHALDEIITIQNDYIEGADE